MQLNKSFEQAAVIVALLSTQDQRYALSAEVIHARVGGSQTYLRKIMRKLVVGGIIEAVSGNKGGFSLDRRAENITLRDIIEASEGEISTFPNTGLIEQVFGDITNVAQSGTQELTDIFAAADRQWLAYFEKVTFMDILRATLGLPDDVADLPVVNWNESITRHDEFVHAIEVQLAQLKH